MNDAVRERARAVRLLVLDVDGVMTDGTLLYGPDGEALKPFCVRDGLGIVLARRAGIECAVISGKRSRPLKRRLDDLRIGHQYLARDDKSAAFDQLLEVTGATAEQTAYAGDDLVDLPLMARVGLPIAVANAEPRVREAASWVTTRRGGDGAVREICEGLLEARGVLDATIAEHLEALS